VKIKCANCNQRTISIYKFYFPTSGIVCPKCNTTLHKKQNLFLYCFLFLMSFCLFMLLTKLFIKSGINRYYSIPIFLLMMFFSLHISTHTSIYSSKSEKSKRKELIILFLIIYISLLLLMKIFNF
jgi:hypothetical protein